MAQLRVFQSIKNNRWTLLFKFDAAAMSDTDQALIAKFGDPEINAGGTYLDGNANEFTLPDEYIRLMADFPYTKVFDATPSTSGTDNPFEDATQTKVEAYRDAIKVKIEAALATLRANTDTFTSEQLYDNL